MINTRGFGVDVMPTYTPVNPEYAAFDPTRLMTGAMESQRLIQALQENKARRELAAQLSAIRPSLINASIASNNALTARSDSDIQLQPARTGVESLKLGNEAAILPLQGKYDVAKTTSDIANLPSLALAQKTGAEAATAKNQIDASLAEKRGSVESSQMDADLTKLSDARVLHDKQLQLIQDKLNDELLNWKSDSDLKKAIERAKLDTEKANANYLNAHADYFDNGGASKAPRDPAQQLGAIGLAMQRLQTGNYTLPNGQTGNLAIYKAETRNPDGSIKTSIFNHPGWSSQPVGLDPTGEQAIKLWEHYSTVSNLLAQKVASQAGGDVGVQVPVAPIKTGSIAPQSNANNVNSGIPVLTPDQVKSLIARTPTGQKFKFQTTDGRVLEAAGSLK